jgi:hypothetical protein
MFGLLVVGFQASLGTLRALEHATHLYKLILKLIHPSPLHITVLYNRQRPNS